MRINLILAILIGLSIGVGSFFLLYKTRIPSDFQFNNTIPKFSNEQQAFIKKTLCTVVNNLEDPASYFVSGITESDSIMVIEMFPLVTLQAGSNSKGTEIITATGESKRFIFDKKLNLLKIE